MSLPIPPSKRAVPITAMKPTWLLPALALSVLLTSACQKKNTEVTDKVAALEKKANEALARQEELERQVEEQKVAAERDALRVALLGLNDPSQSDLRDRLFTTRLVEADAAAHVADLTEAIALAKKALRQ